MDCGCRFEIDEHDDFRENLARYFSIIFFQKNFVSSSLISAGVSHLEDGVRLHSEDILRICEKGS